jgi:hypothetical protein
VPALRSPFCCVGEVLALSDVKIDPARIVIAGYLVGGSTAPYVASHGDLFPASPSSMDTSSQVVARLDALIQGRGDGNSAG